MNAEQFLNKFPSVKLGLDEHYGKQTAIKALEEYASLRVAVVNTWVKVGDNEEFRKAKIKGNRFIILTESGKLFVDSDTDYELPNEIITHVFILPTPPTE